MKNFIQILFILFLIFVNQSNVQALEVIFPQSKSRNTSAEETYILGNVAKNSALKINSKDIIVRKNGSFCAVFPLKEGQNIFVLEEINKNSTVTETYTVNKYVKKPLSQPKINNLSKGVQQNNPNSKRFLKYALIANDNAPVRKSYSVDSDRVTHLAKNTVVFLENKRNKWYKIDSNDENDTLWIAENNIKIVRDENVRPLSHIKNAALSKSNNNYYLKINLDFPVMYKVKEIKNEFEITLYGVNNIEKLKNSIDYPCSDIKLKSYDNTNLTLIVAPGTVSWGYDAYYQNSQFVFKRRGIPLYNPERPLKNITIAIDAGHGGKEAGAMGATKVPEKDINLAIALQLERMLKRQGANVVMTRTSDEYKEIYSRPEIAKNNDALICLSIHSNSMVDGNPYKKHGTSAFYYHPQAKELSNILKEHLVNELGLKDDGNRYASFVLTRPTMPLSVLLEIAYMPNLDEYEKLQSPHFQKMVARAVVNGLRQYVETYAKPLYRI